MANHTPGPWAPGSISSVVTKNGWRLNIALIAQSGPAGNAPKSFDEAIANANLIAAAPELLEVCEEALKLLISETEMKLAYIIAKARGEI